MYTIACNDYLRMGPARSQACLLRRYKSTVAHNGEASDSIVPTLKIQSLRHWSSDHGWAARAEVYDAGLEVSKTDAAAEVLGLGLSLAHNRIRTLKRLAGKLEADLESRLWTKDYRGVTKTQYKEIIRLNASLLREFRGVLDDIAKETGGRVKGIEVTGADGGPIELELGSAVRNALVSRLLQGAPPVGQESPAGGTDD